jgi:hypothetical protein
MAAMPLFNSNGNVHVACFRKACHFLTDHRDSPEAAMSCSQSPGRLASSCCQGNHRLTFAHTNSPFVF